MIPRVRWSVAWCIGVVIATAFAICCPSAAISGTASATRLDVASIVARADPASAVDMVSERPPALDVPERIRLPYRLRRADGNTPGVFWFEVALPPRAAMPTDPAIFIPRLTDGGTFYLNGAPVFSTPGADALIRVRWRRARSFVLPANTLLEDGNVLSARIVSRDFTVDFPFLLLGPADALLAEVEARQWVDQYGSQFTGIVAVIVGVFILSIGWFRRKERYYLWFGLSSLLWAVRTINYSVEVMPADSWWWWRAGHFLTVAAATGTLIAFFFSFASLTLGRKAWAMVAYALIGPLAVVASDGRLHEAVYVWWQGPLFLAIAAALARFAWWGYRQRSYEVLIITSGVLVAIALAANDYATVSGISAHTRIYTLHLALPVLLLTIGILLTIRFVSALRASEDANRVLAERLVDRERELVTQYERVREAEARATQVAERQRIMQDMHDGLGAQLVSALVLVEQGSAGPAEIAVLLRESLDEMRLAVESFGQPDVVFGEALASLRHRMEPRLRAAGMKVDWTTEDAVAALAPDDRTSLQLLRIVQEALANAIRHSKATLLVVRFEVRATLLVITVADNGVGGAPRAVGKGLSGIRQRAHALGGDADIDIDETGTRIVVRVPARVAQSPAPRTGAATLPVQRGLSTPIEASALSDTGR